MRSARGESTRDTGCLAALLKLHGVGPKAIQRLKEALAAQGLALAE